MCKFPFSGRESLPYGRRAVAFAAHPSAPPDGSRGGAQTMRNRRRHTADAVERLRLSIDCMPIATREAMLAGLRANERSSWARTSTAAAASARCSRRIARAAQGLPRVREIVGPLHSRRAARAERRRAREVRILVQPARRQPRDGRRAGAGRCDQRAQGAAQQDVARAAAAPARDGRRAAPVTAGAARRGRSVGARSVRAGGSDASRAAAGEGRGERSATACRRGG